MSEYRLLAKRQPKSFRRFPIRLDEYMIFENTQGEHRTLVLKLHNQSAFELDDILIEIRQKDASGEIIYVANYAFNDIVIESHKNHFIPEKKIKLYEACEAIEYRLLKAESTSMVWENHTWSEKKTSDTEETSHNETDDSSTTPLETQSVTPVPIAFPLVIPLIIIVLHIMILISVFYLANLQ